MTSNDLLEAAVIAVVEKASESTQEEATQLLHQFKEAAANPLAFWTDLLELARPVLEKGNEHPPKIKPSPLRREKS